MNLSHKALTSAKARERAAFEAYRRELNRAQEFPRERLDAAAALHNARATTARVLRRFIRESYR